MPEDARVVLTLLRINGRPRPIARIAEALGWLRNGDEIVKKTGPFANRGWDTHRVRLALNDLADQGLVEEHLSGAGSRWRAKK
tara:strand:+ start:209 stop:457 length:249 start_codon:yes stop_codon:yes gene_type:complete